MRDLSFPKDIVHETLPKASHSTAVSLNLLGTCIDDLAGSIGDMLRQIEVIDVCGMVVHHGLMAFRHVALGIVVGEDGNSHDRGRCGSLRPFQWKIGEVDC